MDIVEFPTMEYYAAINSNYINMNELQMNSLIRMHSVLFHLWRAQKI